MFYDETRAIQMCEEDPSLIFELIKEGHIEVVDKILKRKKVSLNTKDALGNDIITRLLMGKHYDVVLKYMKNKEWNVNNQNNDGNTFAHILVTIHNVHTVKIIEQLKKNKEFIPNIKNNKGQTILDRSINEEYIYTTLQVIQDKRFNNIDIVAFKNIFDTYIKSTYYGKYSKLNNFEMIVDSLEKKESLLPRMEKLVEDIKNEMDTIKNELLTNSSKRLENIINTTLQEAIA